MAITTYHNPHNRTQTHSTTAMSFVPTALAVALGLLMLDAALEMALISSMVYWLHYRAGKDFTVTYAGTAFSLHGKPLGLLGDQGHTSNGAAGTAFVLIGLGGILALWARSRDKHGRRFYHFWLAMTAVSVLLTLAALIWTFYLTNDHAGQTIDVALASTLDNHPYPDYKAYGLDLWTPENWFVAVLQLQLVKAGERRDIESHLKVMKGWRWNLIPLFVLGCVVCALAVADALASRRELRSRRAMEGEEREGKRMST
ncbi:hypothetical protein LTR08_008402 [Meristemomyces frigidus]|nr:hypothetical protein LTR08_008402 [Meristemomyces frigidus]